MNTNTMKRLIIICTVGLSLLALAGAHSTRVTAAPLLQIGCTLPATVTTADELYDCIIEANANGAGLDTITLGADIDLTTLTTSPLPQITSAIALQGAGYAIDGGNSVGLFDVASTGDFTLNQTRLQNGSAAYGGGIVNRSGTVTVTNSTFSGNKASQYGGGISIGFGTVTVTNSTFSGNSAVVGGGAIDNARGTLIVTNSTFSGNPASSGSGGAIRNSGSGSTVAVTNSTFSSNSAAIYGGGIYSPARATVTNSTFFGNSAGVLGGAVYGGNTTMTNSLLTGTTAGGNCNGVTADASNISDDNTCGSATQKTVGEINLDPALADNGGPTFTHALLAGSHAIDYDASASCQGDPVQGIDQRGYSRNIDGDGAASANECDAGAYEYQPPTATLTIAKETDPAGGTDFPFTIDPGTYSFDFKWGVSGGNVAVDAAGNVYVADGDNNRIQKFDISGGYLTQWGSLGTGAGQFANQSPAGIAVDAANNVYVTDFNNNRIQKFDSSGTFVAMFGWGVKTGANQLEICTAADSCQQGSYGSGDGQFQFPTDVTVDFAGNIYVSDSYGNNRIQKFDNNFNFLTKWGSFGSGDGQFSLPRGVAVDYAGNVYVADFNNSRIQKFDSGGAYLTQWGSLGSGDGQFNQPLDIALDAAGNVYVTDIFNNRIQKFDGDGTYLTQWGSQGSGDGQFNPATGVAIDTAGNVYAADPSNNRIQVFTPDLGFTLDNGQSESFDLAPGSYLVSELVPAGWMVDTIDCGDGIVSGRTSVEVNLSAGDVTCTFSNSQPSANACPVDPAYGTVGSELTTLLGTGMGSPTRSRMVAKVVIPNAADITDLYGQMAAKEYSGVRYVRFIFGDKSYQQVPTDGGTFDQGQNAAISWWGDDLTTEFQAQAKPFVKGRWFLQKGMKKMRLPRAIVFYATHDTGDDQYANAWSTFGATDNFVAGTPGFDQTNTNVLSIPETQATTDIVVQLAVTDVNRDPRTIDVIVTAGGVSETVMLTGPTNKKSELLNLFEVTLEDVPAGVDEVAIELVSFLGEGDSAALLGAAAHYECGATLPPASITLEKVLNGPAPQEPWEFELILPDQQDSVRIEVPPEGGSLKIFEGQLFGEFTITETPVEFWETSVECDNGVTSDSNSITFNLLPGQDVICTFNNELPR